MPSSLSTTSNQSPTKSAREDTGKACLFRITVCSNDLKYVYTYRVGKAFEIVPRQAYSSKLYLYHVQFKASKTIKKYLYFSWVGL